MDLVPDSPTGASEHLSLEGREGQERKPLLISSSAGSQLHDRHRAKRFSALDRFDKFKLINFAAANHNEVPKKQRRLARPLRGLLGACLDSLLGNLEQVHFFLALWEGLKESLPHDGKVVLRGNGSQIIS